MRTGRLPVPRARTLLLLLAPACVLALRLLVAGPRSPRAARVGTARGAAVAFSVISIEPGRDARRRGPASRRARPEEEERVAAGARTYEDENETRARQVGPRPLEIQPWASEKPSFAAELGRIVAYVARPQLRCSRVLSPGRTRPSRLPAAPSRWLLCAEDWLLPAAATPCVAYSFSMDGGDADFLKTVSGLRCEVHSFDPSNSNASGGHRGNSLASNHGDRGVASRHKMWLEWRAPTKRRNKTGGNLGSVSQTLADIMAALGHHTVHFLYANLLSAEWRVFQSWIESGTLQRVHHLVATVHLQWAGFEVSGADEDVLHYWFSVLQGLQASGLKLVHTAAGEGHSVLKQTVENAHSSYTLSWVNTRH